MRSALMLTALLASGVAVAGCGSAPPGSAMSPGSPTGPSGASSSLTGAWTGSTFDSSGSMMGAGLSATMMNHATWQITQSGNSFSGSMSFQGYHGGAMAITGTVNGTNGTFTLTMPAGSMMMGGCAAVATGSFEMDDHMVQIHGTYAGSNTCTGPFDHGAVSLTRH